MAAQGKAGVGSGWREVTHSQVSSDWHNRLRDVKDPNVSGSSEVKETPILCKEGELTCVVTDVGFYSPEFSFDCVSGSLGFCAVFLHHLRCVSFSRLTKLTAMTNKHYICHTQH